MIKLKSNIQRFTKILRWFMTYYPQRNSKIFARVMLKNIKQSGNQLMISGALYSNSNPENANLIIRKFRDEELLVSTPITLSPIKLVIRFLLACLWPITKISSYNFSIKTNINWSELPSSIYVISIDFNGTTARMFYKKDTSLTFHLDDNEHTIHIFEEPVISSIRLELYKFGANEFQKIKSYEPDDSVPSCVISEYTNGARDNGIALHHYMIKNSKKIKPVYVIEKNNPDALNPNGNTVVEFGSIEHLKACIDSKVAAFTHHRTYCYPHILRDINKNSYDGVYTVFLQHGVTALKKMVQKHYNKERCQYSSVVVCSDKEAEIFHKYMKFPFNEIHISGFPRYDRLYDLVHQRKTENCILVFPTWRNGLEKKEGNEAKQTEYVRKWREALTKIRANFDGEIVLILHPIIQRHANLFEDYADRIAQASNFQEELVRTLCMITDYSSVCFDALYAKKPVIMFQFDRYEYGFEEDAFINIETELPGIFAETPEDVKRALIELQSTGWNNSNNALREIYFKWDDNKNSQRILDIITKVSGK